MARTAAAWLDAWESGATESPVNQSPSLLGSLELVAADQSIDDLTVGECDARLLELYRSAFGDWIEAVATCPECGDEIELRVPVRELLPVYEPRSRDPVGVELDGYRVTFCVPRNRDLAAVADSVDADRLAELLARCVSEARTLDGDQVRPSEIPATIGRGVAEAMADADPGAHITLTVRCPCGYEWSAELDIRSILWSELTDWVGRTLTEVHQLAVAHGWPESEILAMPAWRRRWYLAAAGW